MIPTLSLKKYALIQPFFYIDMLKGKLYLLDLTFPFEFLGVLFDPLTPFVVGKFLRPY